MIIFLVGFMGSGKTFWASKLSEAMEIPWTDLDQLIEKKESATIAAIFKERGERYFREVEACCLRSLVSTAPEVKEEESKPLQITTIVSTGGGAPCFHDNMEWMNKHGVTVWLNPGIDELAERLKTEMEIRPLLKDLSEEGLHQFITGKLKEREEFYSIAKIELKNTNIAVAEFINLILHA